MILRHLLVVATCLQFSPLVSIAADTEKDTLVQETIDASTLWSAGHKLTAAQAKELEAIVDKNPKDIAIRTKLLGYYSVTQRHTSAEARDAYAKHVLWLIENVPRNEATGTYARLYDEFDGAETYVAAKKLWLKQTKVHRDDTQVLDNATEFFLLRDREMSERFLRQAESLEPKNPHWPERLGQVYSLSAMPYRGEMTQEKRQAAKKAQKEYERALKLTSGKYKKSLIYEKLAGVTYLAGRKRKAAKYANLLLAETPEEKWNYSNALHHGHTILGLLAVDRGASKNAKKHLIKSVQHKGSPQLNSFGPNMRLAKALLDQGEKEAVLQYLELCSKFWESGQKKLETWIRLIQKDETPKFHNLYR